MSSQAVPALKTATEGLLYSSESDEPFEVFEWKDVKEPFTEEQLLGLGGHEADTPVEKVSLDKFFAGLTKEEHWHGDEEKALAGRYQNLLAVIKEHLTGPKVFRVGEVEVAIYVVGRSGEETWVGVKTTAVET
jgi:hypothetical protein